MTILKRVWPLLLIAAAIAALFLTGANRYLSLDALRTNEAALRAFVADNLILSLLAFVALYAATVTTYIPGAAVLTLTGGFLFGVWIGGPATVIGATLGAVGAWWLIRTALGEPLRHRAEKSGGLLKKLIDGFGGNAFSWVLSLRLAPVAPFWLVNAAAGLGSAPLRPYALATFIGVIPGTVIYSGIGAGLGALFRRGERPNLAIIFEPQFLLPLLGLALLSFAPAAWRRLRPAKAAA
ncbi:MAG TPA: TVP38/TMEM64 family protein [Caulobacteraceae bacterium]|nr:TVP38/TMEM64 family protein [Caulobacteraceae bacterium]